MIPDWDNWRKPFLGLNWTQNVKLNSDLKNNTFIGFLDPKNIGKEVAFIILACFVILHYISSSHFEKTAKKHVFTRGILLYFFLVISKTPRRQNQQKSFDLEFFPRLGYFGLRCLQYLSHYCLHLSSHEYKITNKILFSCFMYNF